MLVAAKDEKGVIVPPIVKKNRQIVVVATGNCATFSRLVVIAITTIGASFLRVIHEIQEHEGCK